MRLFLLPLAVGAALASVAGLAAPATAPATTPEAKRPPNVVLILIDDMGWRDLGCTGNTYIETPAIDALAAHGTRFSQAYASAPNCAPTRGCLMSGQYTPRHGVYTVIDPRQAVGSPWHKLIAAESKEEMATEVVTVAESLKAHGYATAMYGMWNLGRGKTGPCTPTGQGFEIFHEPKDVGFEKDAYKDPKGRQIGDVLTDEAIAFIEEKNRARQPFFLYLPYHDVHAPFDPPAARVAKYQAKAEKTGANPQNDPAYAACVENIDHDIGRVMACLKAQGLEQNTLVVFTSDNGATKPFCSPLRGGKGDLYEGGIRVPMIIQAPGLSKPGSVSQETVASIDLYPTLLEWTGATAPANQVLDGRSLLPLLKGESWAPRPMFWHFPCYIGGSTPASAIREGDWKLLEFFEDNRTELYDIRNDPGETQNLAVKESERARSLLEKLHAWQKDTGADCPRTPNPAYDPKATRPKSGPGAQQGQGGKDQGGGSNKGQGRGKNKNTPSP